MKKQDSSGSLPPSQSIESNTELSALTEELQKKVNNVERNISETEDNLARDQVAIHEGKEPMFMNYTRRKIQSTLERLKEVEEDAADAACLKHPETQTMEENLKQLRKRIMELNENHDKIYNSAPSERLPAINWEKIIMERQDSLSSKRFGTDLPTVEGQMEEHSIFHSEVEALGPLITDSDDKLKYNTLLATSTAWHQDLLSLRDYMLRCTIELYWMDRQVEDRINYDWSDANADYPYRQRQHENVRKCLGLKEAAVTSLCDEGEKLIAANHPGKNVIKAHMEAVQADWQEFNSLLICEQSHLSNMEDYHKYYKDERDIQDFLNSLDAELNQKYIPAFKDLYQIEGLISGIDDLVEELDHHEERVKALERRSQQVCPLKFRREMLKMPLKVEALCDFGKITLGERYTLLANNGTKWDVKDLAECQLSVPAVCFVIPPPDPEAISLSEKISNQLKILKQKVSSNKVVLLNQLEVLKKASSSVAGNQDQLCLRLMACLEKVTSDLEKQEKAIYNCLRPPLQQNHPLQDSSDRLQDLKDIGTLIKKIVPEKNSKVHEADTFLTSNPKCTAASQLFTNVNKANNKYNKVNLLLKCAEDRLLNSNRLESALQTVRALLSTYEMALTKDEIMPPDIGSLVRLQDDLFDISSELASKKPTISEMQQSLSVAKWSCENVASQMQEHCPDIDRQEAEAHRLAKRFENLVKRVNNRSKSLQRAKAAYNNYHNKYNDLKEWLSQLPNYEPQEMDDVKQVETKLKKQRSLLSDVARKESDLHDVLKNAQVYQEAVKDYESETEQFKSILDLDEGQVLRTRRPFESPGLKVKNEVSAIETRFTEVNAINKQRLQSLEYAQSLLCQVRHIWDTQTLVRLVAPAEQLWRLKKNLENESDYRKHVEKEIQTIQNDIFLLENQTSQDTIVKKELIKKALDPQLVEEVTTIQQKLLQEQRVTRGLEKELEVLRFKLCMLEKEMGKDAQQYIVKEVLRIEKDRKAEEELRRLNDELNELKRERAIKEKEIKEIQRELSVLTEVKAKEQEVEIQEEVIKVITDPQLESKYQILQENKQKESTARKQLEEELRILQEKLKELEKEKTTAEQKLCIKEILQVEEDTAVLQREVDDLRQQYEDELVKHNSSEKEKADLERKNSSLEKKESKVQEKTHEIIWPDPKAENEVVKLHHDLTEQKRRCKDAELQLQAVQDELKMLRNRSQDECKEIMKEVVKYKMDPETEKELEKLRNEIVDKTYTTESYEKEILKLKDEVQRLKNTKPPVEIKEIVNEVVQYCEDPTTKEELNTLKRKLAEEQKRCLELERTRSDNEEKIKLRKAHLSQVEVVQQEIVKLDEDPLLTSEYQTLSESISNEQKQKIALKEELFQLQCQMSDLDCQLEELKHESSAREKAETELQRLKVQLNDLETREKESKEKAELKRNEGLQKDSQPDREHSILRKKLQEEQEKRILLEKELEKLKQCTMLTKVEVPEKVVLSEKVQIQRNPEAELDTERLRRILEEESNRCCELNKQLNDINSRLCDVSLANKRANEELEYIRNERYTLEMQNQRLKNKIDNLQAEIQVTTSVTKYMTESSPLQNGENLELRLAAIEKELSDLRNTNDEKDQEIKKLQKNLSAARIKREQRESHLRRSVLVIDPGTSKEMTPEEAYSQGLINLAMFVHLQSQECDWEEITLIGPNGESSVLHDRKSGKQFSIEDALNTGTITNKQLQKYRNKEITIQEFGIMVSGNQM
uniref:Periplakin n=1 Tax=Scleropages formosus TaxID=113540 RepID=A0A8C9VP27_SCLFO